VPARLANRAGRRHDLPVEPVLVAYVSGHGFGHFVRSSAVLERLRGARLHLRTNGRAFLLAARAGWATSVSEVDVGPGVIQRSALESDLPATRAALERHLRDWPRLVDEEASYLRRVGARLVFGDVPPLAFAAAAAAGIPSVAMTNFSWSWIYDDYVALGAPFGEAASLFQRSEEKATLLLELAGGGGLDHFADRRPIAPVARPLLRTRAQIRASLPLFQKKARTFVLFSLGGFGHDRALELRSSADHHLIVTSVRLTQAPPHVSFVEPDDTLGHHELVAAADCIIGKPGYGTVAESLAAPTPFCWLSRGDFREQAPLARQIERWLPSAPITLDDLASGRWTEVVDRAMAAPPPPNRPAATGAPEAAAILQALL
jgi:UDP:flavonoid glycosyltransferase YjiC (YdhE family)